MNSEIVSSLITAVVGFLGVGVGSWLTVRDLKEQRRREFLRAQLSELYSPLLAGRQRIAATHIMHVGIAAGRKAAFGGDSPGLRAKALARQDELHAEHYVSQLLPLYKEMLRTFSERLWLAESSTRDHFAKLAAQVDGIDRALQDVAMTAEVRAKLLSPEHTARLGEDVGQHFTRLQSELKDAPRLLQRMRRWGSRTVIRSKPAQDGQGGEGQGTW